ncbi:MAG TPA: Hsp70 family protein [Amycolatopsis sp.]|uniref:Hsp70 family protein n=1 Tax=Amycolatopsis sp. TaxID=37632 RepID=UPI002B4824E6|nr:Hsp70 family protein [Amycolatopsis sp.]HKS48324.1 Hsp70 family protein [Amycolatopsis sp.]
MSEHNRRVFGIDLGTTYSAIAYVDETGRPTVCRNTDNLETIPSVVYFENESNVVVGSVAKESVATEPDRVVSLIKRQMGTRAVFEFDGQEYTPESISALILRQLTQDAAAYSGGEVSSVVITVPAYFGMLERDATRNAGKIAGLDVIGIVPEPVAAALHYEATTGAQGKTILVYDLGGGTFDTTVIRVSETEIEVICTDGDDQLGGADWDARLRDHLLAAFAEQVPPGTDPEEDEEFVHSLSTIAENTKKQLSKVDSRPVALRGAGASARIDVTRAQFEQLTKDLLDKTIEIVQRTLDTLREKDPQATVDDVLLVGGSTSMPAVAQRLKAEFGWEPRLHDPHLAVARGAALYALGRVVHKEQQEAREQATSAAEAESAAADVVEQVAARHGISENTLRQIAKETRNVLPKAFGVKLQDTSAADWQNHPEKFYVAHLVHANDPLPTGARELTAATVVAGQRQVEIELYEQSGAKAGKELAENKPLTDGAGLIDGLPPLPVGSPIHIEMRVDDEGLLTVDATEPSTGKTLNIQVRVSVLSEEQLAQATDRVSALTVLS